MPPSQTLEVLLRLDASQLRSGLGQAAGDVKTFDQQVGKIGDSSTRSFGAAGTAVAAFRGHTELTSQQLAQLGRQTANFGQSLTFGLTVPLVGAGAAAVHFSNDFETAFAHMVGLAGVPQAEVEGLKKSVLDLAGSTAQAPVALAQALYFVESAGLHGATALDTLTVAAKASEAGMGDVQTVADALTSIISAYGSANITAAQAGDILTVAVRDGKAEASAFAPELGRLLPVANSLKIPFNDVAGALAFLTRSSGDTALSATQLEGVMRMMLGPGLQAQKALQDIGLSAQDLRDVIEKQGLAAALNLLNDRFQGNVDAMHKVFPDSRALNGALLLTGQHAADLATVLGDTANATGALDHAQQAVANTSAVKMQQAFADIQVAAIQVGSVIAPFVSTVLGGVADVASAFASLPTPVQNVLLGFLALAAASGPLIAIGGRLAQGWGLSVTIFNDVKGALFGASAAELEATAAAEASAVAQTEAMAAQAARVVANEQLVFSDAEVTAAMQARQVAEMQALVSNDALIASDEALAAAQETTAAASLGMLGTLGLVGAGAGVAAGLYSALDDAFSRNTVGADDFSRALEANNGALDDNIAKLIVDKIEHSGVADVAQRAGISMGTLTSAVTQGADDWGQYGRVLGQFSNAGRITGGDLRNLEAGLRDAGAGGTDFGNAMLNALNSGQLTGQQANALVKDMEGLHNGFTDGVNAANAHKQALGDVKGALDATGPAADGAAAGVDGLTTSSDAATVAAKNQADAYKALDDQLHAQADPLFGMLNALQQNRDAQQAVTDAVNKYGPASQQASDANVKAAQTGLDVQDAAIKLNSQIAQQPGLLDAAKFMLGQWVASGAVTQGQADLMAQAFELAAARANSIPGSVITTVSAPGAPETVTKLQEIDGWAHQLDGRVVNVQINGYVNIADLGAAANRDFHGMRWGGVIEHAQTGLLRDAGVYPDPMYAFAETGTGGEAFIPKFGDRSKDLATLATVARWKDVTVTDNRRAPAGQYGSWSGGGGGAMVSAPTTIVVGNEMSEMMRARLLRDVGAVVDRKIDRALASSGRGPRR